MSARYPIPPFPEGWFRIAWSRDLRARGVVPLRVFGRDLVLFRGESGTAHLLDAWCPHLGAHLGRGGRVKGETIECPFHGWRLDGGGACVLVPIAKKVPARAHVRSWVVREVSGAVLAWMHPQHEAPTWTPSPVEQWGDPGWTRPQIVGPWRVRTHVQEFTENAVDVHHTVVLHGHITRAAETLSIDSSGPVLRHTTTHRYRVFAALEWLGQRVHGTLETRCDGLGRIIAHAHVEAGFPIEHRIVFYPTPIDDDWVELQGAVTLRRLKSRIATRLLHAKSVREARGVVDQDVAIMSHKRYEPRPILVEGEQSTGHYRRWVKQFYAVDPAA